MSSPGGKWRLASAPILLLVVTATARADEAEASAAIARLLDVGWAVTPQARIEADLQYREVVKVAGGDTRALAASWLVLMQQRRFEEALKRLDEHLAKEADDLAALRAKTWIQAILKNYPAALLSANKLSQLLDVQPPENEAERTAHDELVGFLGRLLGYLGGPVAESINQDQRKTAERQILARLDESRTTLFEDARNAVLAKFIEMTDDSADARERALAAAQTERTKTLTELQTDREKIAARTKDLEERQKKIRDEFQSELADIARQDQPLVQDLARLNARSSVLNSDLLAYSADISRLQQLASSEKDPVRRQQYLLEADRLSLIASRMDADLIATNRLASGVRTQRAALAARQAQAQSNTANQIQKIDRELADLGKREKRNDGIEKRASRPATATTSKVRALSAQATALSTYDPFPLEATKARLLESLR